MSPDTLAEWIPVVPWLVALIVLIIVLIAFVRVVWPVLKRWADLADDLLGEKARPGVPARPGLMERMASIEGEQKRQAVDLALVKHEVLPNTGTSLNDAVRRTEAHAKALEKRLDDHISTSTAVLRTLTRENDGLADS